MLIPAHWHEQALLTEFLMFPVPQAVTVGLKIPDCRSKPIKLSFSFWLWHTLEWPRVREFESIFGHQLPCASNVHVLPSYSLWRAIKHPPGTHVGRILSNFFCLSLEEEGNISSVTYMTYV